MCSTAHVSLLDLWSSLFLTVVRPSSGSCTFITDRGKFLKLSALVWTRNDLLLLLFLFIFFVYCWYWWQSLDIGIEDAPSCDDSSRKWSLDHAVVSLFFDFLIFGFNLLPGASLCSNGLCHLTWLNFFCSHIFLFLLLFLLSVGFFLPSCSHFRFFAVFNINSKI